MKKIVECIPNFSEGRDSDKIELIVKTIRAVPRVAVLDYSMDPDHNRSVVTLAGDPQAIVEAAVRAAAVAVELIDLNTHIGEHPRLGALDVLPFVPIRGVTMEECVELARVAGKRIATELAIPVYLYEKAATRQDRVDLANVRRGEFEALRQSIESDPAREPDFGARRIHPTAGAMAVGARSPLIAFNVNLATDDLIIAEKIAKAVRASDGGLLNVKAIGLELKMRRQTQVSMNLIDYKETPIYRTFEMVKREASRYGAPIFGCEIVGLIPQDALNACSEFYLQIENFSDDIILEKRLNSELSKIESDSEAGSSVLPRDNFANSVWGNFEDPDDDDSIEGEIEEESGAQIPLDGGSAAAIAGSLAAALGKLVCNMLINQKKSPEVEARGVLEQLDQLSSNLREASFEESKNRKQVAEAVSLPRETKAERLARAMALEQATKNAVGSPLRIARNSMEVLELLNELTEIGNPGAFADVTTGAQLAMTAMRGAAYSLFSNLMTISDEDFNRRQRSEITDLIARGRDKAEQIESMFFSLYPRD